MNPMLMGVAVCLHFDYYG